MSLVIGLLAAGLVGGATSFFTERFKKRKHKMLVGALVAVMAALVFAGVAWMDEWMARPEVRVATTKTDRTVAFEVRVASGEVEFVNVDYHVTGHVLSVEQFAGMHRASATATIEGEPVWPPYFTNRLHLDIRNIRAKALYYTAFWQPAQTGGPSASILGVSDLDRYRVSYSWFYKGDRKTEIQWYLMSNNEPCAPPEVETSVLLLELGHPTDVKLRKVTLLDEK